MQITNIYDLPIEQLWLGVLLDGDIFAEQGRYCQELPWEDDITGCLRTWPNPINAAYTDSLFVAWSADDDGDVCGGPGFPIASPRGIAGVRILSKPHLGARINYNWFTSTEFVDWGPRLQSDIRSLGTGGNGRPYGDATLYHFMRNGEVDYDQVCSAFDFSPIWQPPAPAQSSTDIADGMDHRYILSIGPLPILGPGETVDFAFALVAGGKFHVTPDNPIDPSAPEAFASRVDFRDLAKNAWWAGYFWDNYGVDTDGDGYSGEFYRPVIGGDTVYYTGDGCPDLAGPEPPPCPDSAGADFKLQSKPGELIITWSGRTSELDLDPLTGLRDFEGWRAYVAERNSIYDKPDAESYSLIASWDVADFRRYVFDPKKERWEMDSHPLTTESWRKQFSDPQFEPRMHPYPSFSSCYRFSEFDESGLPVEKCAYFVPHDANHENEYSAAGETTMNLIQRVAVRDSILDGDTVQFGEYQLRMTKLLPSSFYFVSITAFDFGNALIGLEPQSCPPGGAGQVVVGHPLYSADVVEEYYHRGGVYADSVRVSVYPNPYKISAEDAQGNSTTYFAQGFEGVHGQESLREQDRRIHFINVPSDATISIYSLDGDLIRTLEHPDRHLSNYSSEISWDLVSRNTQAVTSGIYIYRVDSKLGSQVGKLVIIK